MSQFQSAAPGIETRSIEESLKHGADAMSRAESILAQLHEEVTGYRSPEVNEAAIGAVGISHDADRLAGRLESFVVSLDRTRSRITATNVISASQQNSAKYA